MKIMDKFNLLIPRSVDKTSNGEIVKRANIGEPGYGENIEFTLQISFINNRVSIDYYGEDDTFLDFDSVLKAIEL